MTSLQQESPPCRVREIRRGGLVVTLCESDVLTPTETDIVYHLLKGFTLVQMTYIYNRSIKTLSSHKRNISRKLGNASTATLLLALLEKGIVTLRPAGSEPAESGEVEGRA